MNSLGINNIIDKNTTNYKKFKTNRVKEHTNGKEHWKQKLRLKFTC